MKNAGLDEAQDGIKTARRNINNLRYADDNTLMAESKEELKNLLLRVKEGSWLKCVSWLKTQHSKTKIMASSPITSWKIDGETMNTVTIFLGSKITVGGNFSHEIKTLTPWKKSYNKPRWHIKKHRHNFADRDLYSQSYGFFQ